MQIRTTGIEGYVLDWMAHLFFRRRTSRFRFASCSPPTPIASGTPSDRLALDAAYI